MRVRWVAFFACVFTFGSAMCVNASSPSGRFPPSIYPLPRYFPAWGSPGGCPSLSGLQTLGPGTRNAAFPTLTRFGRSSLQTDLHLSDRTLWPSLLLEWRHTSGRPVEHGLVSRTDVVKAHPARRSPYAKLIRHNCGAMTLAHSLEFVICRRPCYPAERGYMDLLERRGHWLIWFTYP